MIGHTKSLNCWPERVDNLARRNIDERLHKRLGYAEPLHASTRQAVMNDCVVLVANVSGNDPRAVHLGFGYRHAGFLYQPLNKPLAALPVTLKRRIVAIHPHSDSVGRPLIGLEPGHYNKIEIPIDHWPNGDW